jgi:O-antigen/teichoic acid export membrane protein
LSALHRQGAWAVADQVLSSGTNFVPAILLARVLGPATFGAFSLAFLAWFGALQLLRSALMQPYTLAAAPLEGAEWRDITSHASGAVVIGGVIVGGAFAIVSLAVGVSSSLGQALLAVAVLAPGMALQEFWRVASFAAQRARTAAANDAFWAIGQVAAFAFVLTSGKVTVAGGLFAWGVGAWVGAGLGILQLSVRPKVALASARWARNWGRIGAWFTAASATFTLGSLVIAIIVAAELGNASLGLYRSVQNLFGPLQLLTIGGEMVFVPHLVRRINRTSMTAIGESSLYALVMAGSTVAYGLVLLVSADMVLTKVFGTAFATATVLVLPIMVAFTLDAVASGAVLLLRARAKGGRLFVAQSVSTSLRVSAVAALASVDGLRGAGWGYAVGSGVAAVVFWTQVLLPTARERAHRNVVQPKLSGVLLLADPEGSSDQ